MATYRMDDGCVVKTENATRHWSLEVRPYGYGHNRRTLYRSRRGRYWLENNIDYSESPRGIIDWAEWVSPEEAVRLLLAEGHELPADLVECAAKIEE